MSTNVNLDRFTAEQMAFMIALADPNDRRTQEEIARDLNVRPETLCRWKKLPDFGHALWELARKNLEAEVGRISAVLLSNALSGNYRFVRMFYEIIGVLGTHRESTPCQREHVLDIQEFSKNLATQLTESQLAALVNTMMWESGIPLSEGIYICNENIAVMDSAKLIIE